MLKIPKTVKCGASTYQVKMVDDLIITDGNSGEHRPYTRVIAIDKRSSFKTQTFIHEYLHAINTNYRTELDDTNLDRVAGGIAELFQSLGIEIDWNERRIK